MKTRVAIRPQTSSPRVKVVKLKAASTYALGKLQKR